MTQRFPAFQHSSKDHFDPTGTADTSNPSMFVLSLDIRWLVLIAPASWTNLLVIPGHDRPRNALESTGRLYWPKGVKNLLPWGGKSRWDSTLPKERAHTPCTNRRDLGKRNEEITIIKKYCKDLFFLIFPFLLRSEWYKEFLSCLTALQGWLEYACLCYFMRIFFS